MATVPSIEPAHACACVYALIERQAAVAPGRVAIVDGDTRLTYGELNARANRVAHLLRQRGAAPDTMVGLCMSRSLDQLVALLGVMKSGAAYLPIDPAHPEDRVAFMLRDTDASLVLTESALEVRIPAHIRRVRMDADRAAIDAFPGTNLPQRGGPEHLAYCIFTSGSTGAPKAVAVPRRALTNQALAMTRILSIGPDDRVLQFTSIAFDAALEEILPTWLRGAALVLMPERLPASAAFVEWLARQRVTVVSLPPSYWHQWVDDLARHGTAAPPALRVVFVGGEKVAAEKLRRWQALPFAAGLEWIVDYGPTETTISCTTFRLGDAQWDARVPIGRALANVTVTVLDDRLQPVPIGRTGELCVGGAGVARGYWGRAGLTAERFLPDPSGPPGARMYRTGDLGRLRADGLLEFVGRADDQIKIRGHRIEPGEIESVLMRCDGVRAALVLPREQGARGPRLVAYVVGDGVTEDGLRAALASTLPDVMMPAAFVLLDALPLSPVTGKIDRARLPEPAAPVPALDGASDLQRALAQLWANVVGHAPPSMDHGFVASGGDSLAWLRLVTRL
ncbi:amino acid adenylation domain-containing protein, partial [Paraburkholderia sp. A1RI_3L]